MLGKEIYKIWAPKSKWQGWVRPVLFVGLDMDNVKEEYFSRNLDEILYKEHINKETAFIIDLPGAESVREGLSLAKLGVRPIAIYNGTDEQLGSIIKECKPPENIQSKNGESFMVNLNSYKQQRKEGPIVIYSYIPLNEQQMKASNIEINKKDPFKQ